MASSTLAYDGGLTAMVGGALLSMYGDYKATNERKQLQKNIATARESHPAEVEQILSDKTEQRKKSIRNRLNVFGWGAWLAGFGNTIGGFASGAPALIDGGLITSAVGAAIVFAVDIKNKMAMNRLQKRITAQTK